MMPRDSTPSHTSFISPSLSSSSRGLPPPSNPPSSSSSIAPKKRTSHACDRCRLMRTKCSGGTRCSRCTRDDAVCVYGDHKREKSKKDLAESAGRIKELEEDNRILAATLRQFMTRSDVLPADQLDLVDVLAKYSEEDRIDNSIGSRSQSRSVRSPALTTEARLEGGGEVQAPSSIGSPGRQGELFKVVDLDHGTGAAGFIGKMSEMSWMQRCREYLTYPLPPSVTDIDQPTLDQHATAAGNLNYFMDDLNLLGVDEDHVNALQWPSSTNAIILTEAFFHSTQGVFQFLSRETFLTTMYNFPGHNLYPSWAERRWLALANLVWAIGTKWLQLTELDIPEMEEDHVVFYARARALGLDHRISFDHPDEEMLQGIGLMAFYLLTNGSISRAWNTVGNAVRHAMTLGLHLKVSDPVIDEVHRNRRARTWFSLYKLQMLIAEITGRPQLIRTAHVTIPLEILDPTIYAQIASEVNAANQDFLAEAGKTWLNFLKHHNITDHEPLEHTQQAEIHRFSTDLPAAQSFFLYHVRLCQLSEEIADQLFTGRQSVPWSETQLRIEELQRSLDAWQGTLPDELKLISQPRVYRNMRPNIQLAMYGCSVAMILNRPCLCDIKIENESQHSKEFNVSSARACVNAAISMIGFIPDEFSAYNVYRILPWWTLLHYLCQANAVLLLELCLDAQHFQGDSKYILHAFDKTMMYLSCMTKMSVSAYRAWRIFHELYHRVSLRYGGPSLYELNVVPDPPPNWSAAEENSILFALQ